MIDFDKLFEDYFTQWYKSNASNYESEDEIEDAVSQVYGQWCDLPLKALSGKSPNAYFNELANPDVLINMLIESFENGGNPCMLLTERIEKVKECAGGLQKIIEGSYGEELKSTAINLLSSIGARPNLEFLCGLVLSDSESESLTELSLELLSQYADDAAPIILSMVDNAGFDAKMRAAEILCSAKRDDRIYSLLTDLFKTGKNIPLCAGLLGKYGDERAASVLYPALDSCNYFEYIEIKNAIERLGGIVDDLRDFTNDPYYKILKGVQ